MSAPSPFAALDIRRDPTAVADIWRDLEAAAPATFYQTRGFVLPWFETLGRDLGYAPLIVTARDAAGQPAALLALAEKSVGPLRVAFFAGGKDSNANLPLVRKELTPDAADFAALLREAGQRAGVDLFVFLNQPRAFDGRDNPLTLLASQDSPSRGHLASLAPDGEALLAQRLSKDSRKKYRKKEARLTEVAPLAVVSSDEPATIPRLLDAFFRQKLARFEEKNIVSTFDRPTARAFIEAAVAAGAVKLYGLAWRERIVAVYGGGGHGQRFSAMFNSFEADEDIAKSSPGDLLLFALMKRLGAEGFASLDLGVGEARYKNAVCDRDEALADTFVAITAKGKIARAAFIAALRTKAAIKRNPRLMALMSRARAALKN